ncbi:RNA-guided endonuclease IscB [Bacillus sp. NPDC094106]|uniref:RNA-guided endonuclease IscB n=1 Tax=Bacillus sp. NPDC094106 TaxID=3363949 RepID=UPI003830E88C
MWVCVLNKDKTPINPCHPARARKLLRQKRAVIHCKYPFVIRLKEQINVSENNYEYECRLDPGSKATGVAIVKNKKEVIVLGEIHHKQGISEALQSRSAIRRNRRNRKTGYRRCKWAEAIRLLQRYKALKKLKKPCKKPSFGKESKKGWIAPSLQARVLQTENWFKKIKRYMPITSIGMELVKFDMQKMQDPDVNGVLYQQGTLMGYEVREYLLEKWERKCSYCEKTDVPLEIEHIMPRSRGGSDRISNLCLACRECNEEKDNLLLDEWLQNIKKKKNKRHLTIVKNIPIVKKQCKTGLRDAAAVNTTRWKLYETLQSFGLPVTVQSGAKTKMQRIQNDLPKEHYYDALCVGTIPNKFKWRMTYVIEFHAMGRGNRQMARVDRYGFPLHHQDEEKYDKNGKRKGHRS